MANITVNWMETGDISIFYHAKEMGFDLSKYDNQKSEVQIYIKKGVIDSVVDEICEQWRGEERVSDYYGITRGAYVISISDGFGINYKNDVSGVIYIGRGSAPKRIRAHLQNWIFDMSLSLRDIKFKFYIDEIGDRRSPEAFMDFEGHLLDCFGERYGEKPLINKYAGRANRRDHYYDGNWKKPLNQNRKSFLWTLRPTEKNSWFKQIDDE